MTQDEIIELTRRKLEYVSKEIETIELTNDKSRRTEWRELKKYRDWANEWLSEHTTENKH